MKSIKKDFVPGCFNRDVTFLIDETIYSGTIQDMGNYGVTISARNLINIPNGKRIRINVLSRNQIDVKSAEIVYSDKSGFGAKFI